MCKSKVKHKPKKAPGAGGYAQENVKHAKQAQIDKGGLLNARNLMKN